MAYHWYWPTTEPEMVGAVAAAASMADLHGGCAFGMRRLGFGGAAEDVGCENLQGRCRIQPCSCAMTASGGVGRSFHARFGVVPPFMETPPNLGFTLPPKMFSTLHQQQGSTGGSTML